MYLIADLFLLAILNKFCTQTETEIRMQPDGSVRVVVLDAKGDVVGAKDVFKGSALY